MRVARTECRNRNPHTRLSRRSGECNICCAHLPRSSLSITPPSTLLKILEPWYGKAVGYLGQSPAQDYRRNGEHSITTIQFEGGRRERAQTRLWHFKSLGMGRTVCPSLPRNIRSPRNPTLISQPL